MSRAEAHVSWDDDEPLKAADPAPRRVRERGPEPRLSRAHAAGFADAFDLDGAFGAPRRRFDRDGQDTGEGRVIVLERAPAHDDTHAEELRLAEQAQARAEELRLAAEAEARHDELLGAPPEIDPDTGRRVVRITGRPNESVSPRRLRETEPRRGRSVADRAAARPDRIALYAVLLGLFLVVLAAASAGAQP